MDLDLFESRKRDHIHLALSPENQALGGTGLDHVHLYHEALPELDLSEITLDSVRFGKSCTSSTYISGMTAGHADAAWINSMMAAAAQARGWAMGVGSQRRELEASQENLPDRWKEFRQKFPKLSVFANLGITQIVQAPIDSIRRVIDSLEANALVIHTNVLQESLQSEGTPSFRGALSALELVCKKLETPVVLKETGCGFAASTLLRVKDIGLAALDVSGFGGTHWGRIEGARASVGSVQAEASATFAKWGESTVSSVLAARKTAPALEVWGSGGVRSGLDAAKLIALGASQVGFAQPVLKAVLGVEKSQAEQSLNQWMEKTEFEFKVALLCTGSKSPLDLRAKEGSWRVQS